MMSTGPSRVLCGRAAAAGAALLLALACASSKVVERLDEQPRGDLTEPPARILVYDFAASPEDVSLDASVGSRVARAVRDSEVSQEERALGRAAATALSQAIVSGLRKIGLPGERADDETRMGGTLLGVEGQFVKIDEGNRTERLLIGFGLGGSEVRTEVQFYAIEKGYRNLARKFSTVAEGSKLPGATTPLGVGAAAGAVGRGVAVAAGKTVASEVFSESVKAGAERSAKQIVREIALFHAERGWLPEDEVPDKPGLGAKIFGN
jgi:hypothetical protein